MALCSECIKKENERLEETGSPMRFFEPCGCVMLITPCEICGKDAIYYDEDVDKKALGIGGLK